MKSSTNNSLKTLTATEQTTGESAQFSLIVKGRSGNVIARRPLLDPVTPPAPVPVPEPTPVPVPIPTPVPTPTPTPDPTPVPLPQPGSLAALPELPRVIPPKTIPLGGGATMRVAAGGDLQTALNSAQPGDTVLMAAGATFVGNFVLPQKAATTNGVFVGIELRTDVPKTALDSAGRRITPTKAATLKLARIITPNNAPAIKTVSLTNPTSRWALSDFEVTGTLPQTAVQYGLIWLGDGGWIDGGETQTSLDRVPSDIILDRLYIHGNATLNCTRAIALNSTRTAVVSCWISDIHAAGFDSQSICPWNTPGALLIDDCYLSAAGENFMAGGADPGIQNCSPSDITIERCHLPKDLAWKGGPWSIKNLFETKHVKRLRVRWCKMEHCWAASQTGMAVVLKSATNGGPVPWTQTADVTFEYNWIDDAAHAFNAAANPDAQYGSPATPMARVLCQHNLFTNIGGTDTSISYRFMILMNDLRDLTIRHNTFRARPGVKPMWCVMESFGTAQRVAINDNLGEPVGEYYAYHHTGSAAGAAALEAFAPGTWESKGNVIPGVEQQFQTPTGNTYPASVSLSPDGSLPTGSPFANTATDGTSPGANITELLIKLGGVVVPA